jgi:hypothetical protein
MREFVTLKGFNSIENNLPCINFFVRMDDNDLHLGDKLFLSKIADRLSLATNIQNDNVKKLDICVTLPRRLSDEVAPSIGIDWTAKKHLPPEMMVLEKLKNIGICSNIFYDASEFEKVIIVSTEIASSTLRIVGLKRKIVLILKLFSDNGFKIIHIGKSPPRFLHENGIRFTNISGLKKCEEVLSSESVYAFVGFDNYWMHVAALYGKRMYVIQRRKFFRVNLTNHMCSLNYIMSNNNIITYV